MAVGSLPDSDRPSSGATLPCITIPARGAARGSHGRFSNYHVAELRHFQRHGQRARMYGWQLVVTDQHGRKRVYGVPNAGFERFPGLPRPPCTGRGEIEGYHLFVTPVYTPAINL
jgi:hypothetical protein